MPRLQDQRCDAALIRLNDEICSYERTTGREYALILVPFSPDEQVFVSLSGKPMENLTALEALAFALRERGGFVGLPPQNQNLTKARVCGRLFTRIKRGVKKVKRKYALGTLREEVKQLRFKLSCFRYVTAALCMAQGNPHNALLPIAAGEPESWAIQAYPRYCKILEEASQRTIEIVKAELDRLKEMFPNPEKGF